MLRLRAESGTRTRDLLITNELLYQLSYFGKLFFFEKRCKFTALFGYTKRIARFFVKNKEVSSVFYETFFLTSIFCPKITIFATRIKDLVSRMDNLQKRRDKRNSGGLPLEAFLKVNRSKLSSLQPFPFKFFFFHFCCLLFFIFNLITDTRKCSWAYPGVF